MQHPQACRLLRPQHGPCCFLLLVLLVLHAQRAGAAHHAAHLHYLTPFSTDRAPVFVSPIHLLMLDPTSPASPAPPPQPIHTSGTTIRELQEASPELAAALRARQESSARTRRLLSDEADEAAAAAGSSSGQPPGWSNNAAPFGGELAALLRKRWVPLWLAFNQTANAAQRLSEMAAGGPCSAPFTHSACTRQTPCLRVRFSAIAGESQRSSRRQLRPLRAAGLRPCRCCLTRPAANLRHASSYVHRSCCRKKGSRRGRSDCVTGTGQWHRGLGVWRASLQVSCHQCLNLQGGF